MMYDDVREALEKLVDTHSLRYVIDALSDVCEMKSEHMNRQNTYLADVWKEYAQRLAYITKDMKEGYCI